MNEKNKPESGASAESAAILYVDEQLNKVSRALRRTRIVGVILAVIVFCYFGYITYSVKKLFLSPKAAAARTTMQLKLVVQDQGPILVKRLKEEVPGLIRQVPDLVLRELPRVRIELEGQIESAMRDYCHSSTEILEEHLNSFLEENQEAIKEFLDIGQNQDEVKAMLDNLESDFVVYLGEPGEDGESLREKLDKSLISMNLVKTRLDRLAHASNLTPKELKERYAIALITQRTEETLDVDSLGHILPFGKKP